MDKRQLAQLLSGIDFSATLSQRILDHLADVSVLRAFPVGAVIFGEGDQNDRLYLLCSGKVDLEMNLPGRGPQRIQTLGPGDMLGWSALLGQGQMTATARAVEETQAIAASSRELLELCEEDGQLGYELMRRMAMALSSRLLDTRRRLLEVSSDLDNGGAGA
jgi:CRP/FNR family cyclic AMP-dependent transcriptional regulator